MIKVLDIGTINKIAAGEVIERPFSVIKELVENSIDAGSTKVVVEIREGGVPFIRVTDNGYGIEGDEIETAFKSHATSKITNISDLNSLRTLGFRGEALASIASVSQLEVTSKTKDSDTAAYVEIYGGEVIGKRETAGVNGTVMLVRNLFYNTPARKKFLKSTQAEAGQISDFMNKIALSRPDISIRYINNGNEALSTTGSGDLQTAIFSVYGAEYAEKLLRVDYNYRDVIVTGFAAKPELSRSNRLYEDLFVNGRFVKDKTVSKAAEDAYNTYLPQGKFPSFVLNMSIDGEMVDINAHPQKLEIRFRDETIVYEAVYNAVREALKSHVLIHSAVWESKPAEKQNDGLYTNKIEPQTVVVKEAELYGITQPTSVIKLEPKPSDKQEKNNNPGTYDNYKIMKESSFDGLASQTLEREIFSKIERSKTEQQEIAKKDKLFKDYKIVGRLFSTYWIVEQESKMYVIDQHAAHERIIFEKLKKGGGLTSSQRLVEPERLTLTERERAVLTENIDSFLHMGFEVAALNEKEFTEPKEAAFIADDYYLLSVPVLYRATLNKKALMDILDTFTDNNRNGYDISDYIATMACRAAVKANDKMTESEAAFIVDSLLGLENPYTCPHGRPTVIEMTKYELEKKFKRV